LASSLYEVGKAILSIPIRILEGLVKMSNNFASIMAEFAKQVELVRKQFGDLKGPIASTILYTDKAMKGWSQTGLSTWRVFGNMAQRLEYVRTLITEMGASVGPLTKEFRDQGGALLAYNKGLGLAGDQMKAVAQYSIALGKPFEKNLRDITKQSLALGKAFGVDAKLISREMGKALQDGITMTATPTAITLVPVLPTQVSVYAADTQAGLAGAAELDRVLDAKFSI
jgi:hypothetical protein